jgi:hypothetical protein
VIRAIIKRGRRGSSHPDLRDERRRLRLQVHIRCAPTASTSVAVLGGATLENIVRGSGLRDYEIL